MEEVIVTSVAVVWESQVREIAAVIDEDGAVVVWEINLLVCTHKSRSLFNNDDCKPGSITGGVKGLKNREILSV